MPRKTLARRGLKKQPPKHTVLLRFWRLNRVDPYLSDAYSPMRQITAAKLIGISCPTLSCVENGAYPSLKNAIKILNFYGKPSKTRAQIEKVFAGFSDRDDARYKRLARYA